MIYILTVHWGDDKWIAPQRKYLDLHTNEQYKIYAFVSGISNDVSDQFDFVSTEGVDVCYMSTSHAVKLNILADIACNNAADDDLLIFLDGDAFPITDYLPQTRELIKKHKLVAVQRIENANDIQPHPVFCATTVKFWKELKGDWKPGYKWKNKSNAWVTDTGGNLLQKLQENEVDWYPLQRTNKHNSHPVWYGIYGDMIYHHGAGFRDPICRQDTIPLEKKYWFKGLIYRLRHSQSRASRASGDMLLRIYFNPSWDRDINTIISRNTDESRRLFQRLTDDEEFWKEFI